MADSPSHVLPCALLSQPTPPEIPVEIISDEEMAIIEAAFMAARPSIVACSSSSFSLLPSRIQRSPGSVGSLSVMSKRGYPSLAGEPDSVPDIEDSGQKARSPVRKKSRASQSLLDRFRRKGRLFVTDFTRAEWCEKQLEFDLCLGKKRVSKAMKAGLVRHAELEEQSQTRIVMVGFVEGIWIVGVIDELRMPLEGSNKNPTLVDTKTRVRAKLPGEPQQRNGRLQLMCYKYLWDNLVTDNFPSQRFLNFFSLNPHHILSDDIRKSTSASGFPADTLDDLMKYFRNTSKTLPIAHEQLLLRYELQEDRSLLGEDKFAYNDEWLKAKLQHSLEFWKGEREATYTVQEESWKCSFCQYVSVCPYQIDPNDSQSSQNDPNDTQRSQSDK
ncbi:hypothetical protein V2J09_020861 [Rumex salicifolius]